jgi:hypothetical protein
MNENDLRRALGHLQKGDWQAAHGIVHLMEGDASNRHFDDDVGKEIAALSASLRK